MCIRDSLKSDNLHTAVMCQPCFIGVRGAICESDRTASISEIRLANFIELLVNIQSKIVSWIFISFITLAYVRRRFCKLILNGIKKEFRFDFWFHEFDFLSRKIFLDNTESRPILKAMKRRECRFFSCRKNDLALRVEWIDHHRWPSLAGRLIYT